MRATYLVAAFAGACAASLPATTDASLPAQDDCAKQCYDAFNKCRGESRLGMASCSSDYQGCLGYLPVEKDGSVPIPTACSKAAAPTTTSSPPGPEPTTTTTTTTTTSLSLGAAPTTTSLPLGPGHNTTTPVAHAGAAAHARPLVAVLALAALAVY